MTIMSELAETARLVAAVGDERRRLARTVASMGEAATRPPYDIPMCTACELLYKPGCQCPCACHRPTIEKRRPNCAKSA